MSSCTSLEYGAQWRPCGILNEGRTFAGRRWEGQGESFWEYFQICIFCVIISTLYYWPGLNYLSKISGFWKPPLISWSFSYYNNLTIGIGSQWFNKCGVCFIADYEFGANWNRDFLGKLSVWLPELVTAVVECVCVCACACVCWTKTDTLPESTSWPLASIHY